MVEKSKTALPEAGQEIKLEGVTICQGIGIGRVRMLGEETTYAKKSIASHQVPAEQERYTRATELVSKKLHEHVEKFHYGAEGHASMILQAHKAMMSDEQFHESVRGRIATEYKNAEWAVEEETEKLIQIFEATRNVYFQGLAEDIRDMAGNILRELSETQKSRLDITAKPGEPHVLVSGHLYPSDVVFAHRCGAAGFVTESRALSSHAAILLKGFAVPGVGSVPGLKESAKEGDLVIVDAINGLVILRPRPSTLEKYIATKQKMKIPVEIPPLEPCATKDGVRIQLMANIENPEQVHLALRSSIEGIGLFRTEFFVLTGEHFPTEEEQYQVYHQVIKAAAGRRVVIRTFDIGADKQTLALHQCTGQNPALGVRGIRRHLEYFPEELRIQLRAILRASVGRDVGILIPMVTTVDDIKNVKQHLESIKEELRSKNMAFSEDIRLGAMVEVPAAAIALRELLSEVDFVSIGTNDLLQYFMAADRDNERVLQYNNPQNSTFIWLLRLIIEQAAEAGREKDVTICGEIASYPDIVPLLLDLGYRSFSISPVAARRVRDAIKSVDLRSAANE